MAIQKTKRGFTIIEVVLVLAIAGLIFLMVFVALPALQRSQRDTRRREDMARVNNALVQYQTNNSTRAKNLPAYGAWQPKDGDYDFTECTSNHVCRFVRDYLNSAEDTQNTFLDPDGIPYGVIITDYLTDGNPKYLGAGENTIKAITTTSGSGESATETSTGQYQLDSDFADRTVFIVPGAKCDNEYVEASTVRHFAILYRLEGSGVYCIDDQ